MSSPRRLGLPTALRMRHDTHFVDQLARPAGSPLGRLVAIEDIDPNPTQPRRSLGNLSELTASIREKGVLEPILVRPSGGRFEIVAGERRFRAAVEAGLDEVPCVVREATDAEMMELALVENLQRRDLSPFEESDGLRSLADRFGYTHEMMAEKLGKSRSSITEALAIAAMPRSVRDLCRLADIRSKSLLLQVVRQSNPEKMAAFVRRVQESGVATRDEARRLARSAKSRSRRGRPRHYVFRYKPSDGEVRLALEFKKSQVSRDEVIRVLKGILEELSG